MLALVSILASLGFVGTRLLGPGDGAVIGFYGGAWTAHGVRVETDDRASSLVSGDLVVGLAGRSLEDWLNGSWDPTLDRAAIAVGRSIVYDVVREGELVMAAVTLSTQSVTSVLAANWSTILFVLALQAVAAYVLWRRPAASAAVALMVAASAVTASAVPWLLGVQASDIARGWPFLLHALTTGVLYMLLWPAGGIHLPLTLFRAGDRGPSRRLLAAAYGLPFGGYLAALLVLWGMAPSTTAWVGSWPTAQFAVILPTVVVGVVVTALGYRRAGPRLRTQFRWAATGGIAAWLTFVILFVGPEFVTGSPLIPWSTLGLFALPLPIGIAASIVRNGLLDIEIVVNRTLVYGGVTMAILATYVGAVSLLGTVLGVGEGFGVSLLATGVAALVALPVRDVLQRAVNRLMYGDRDDPYRALVRLGQRLEGTLDPLEGPAVVVRTVADSLRVPWAGLRIGPERDNGRLFEYGRRPAGSLLDVPLLFGAETVGHLLIAQRGPAEPLSAADRRLLDALARQAGAAIHALSLTFELVDSRQRIVAAREEERRRIRRDLHDGLGPTLAAIGMRAEAAAELVAQDPASAAGMLGELQLDATSALGEIRRLVDALRPPALDELGLVGAISQQADRLSTIIVIQVDAPEQLPELPAAIEVAAYRIALEAMTNAVRHSGAGRCDIQLTVEQDGALGRALVVEVADDGQGMDQDAVAGVGLRSMRERSAEVGGALEVAANRPGGTRVTARLPLTEPAEAGAGQ